MVGAPAFSDVRFWERTASRSPDVRARSPPSDGPRRGHPARSASVADLTITDVDEIKRFLFATREDVLTWQPSPWERDASLRRPPSCTTPRQELVARRGVRRRSARHMRLNVDKHSYRVTKMHK